MSDKQWLRIREAAQRSGMSVAWWRQRVLRREVPFAKIGRAILIDVTDIERMLRDARVEPSPRQPVSSNE